MELSHQFFKQPSPLWEEVLSLRLSVFVEEMQVPVELEVDEFDKTAIHLCLEYKKKTIGTLRLVILDNPQNQNHSKQGSKQRYANLGRVVVHSAYRRRGIGSHMMKLAIDYCKQGHCSKIILGSQIYITDFYQALGFMTQGEVFDDAGIPHISMYMDI